MTNPNDPVSYPSSQALTKREYLAAMAMTGIMFWDATVNDARESGKLEMIAEQAVGMADALLAELEKKT